MKAFRFTLLLVAVLAVLFWGLHNPDYTLFSNDSPLGMGNSDWSKAGTDSLHGDPSLWNDLNWLGIHEIDGPPNAYWMLLQVGCPGLWVFCGPFMVWVFFRFKEPRKGLWNRVWRSFMAGFFVWLCFRSVQAFLNVRWSETTESEVLLTLGAVALFLSVVGFAMLVAMKETNEIRPRETR